MARTTTRRLLAPLLLSASLLAGCSRHPKPGDGGAQADMTSMAGAVEVQNQSTYEVRAFMLLVGGGSRRLGTVKIGGTGDFPLQEAFVGREIRFRIEAVNPRRVLVTTSLVLREGESIRVVLEPQLRNYEIVYY